MVYGCKAVFLSVHFNGAPRTAATGVETYYYTSQSAALAAAVHREVLRLMGTPIGMCAGAVFT